MCIIPLTPLVGQGMGSGAKTRVASEGDESSRRWKMKPFTKPLPRGIKFYEHLTSDRVPAPLRLHIPKFYETRSFEGGGEGRNLEALEVPALKGEKNKHFNLEHC